MKVEAKQDLKQCTKCHQEKTLDNFFKGKYNHWCKDCRYQWSRDYYKKRKPIDRKLINAKRNYGIAEEDFKTMMKRNTCEICKEPFKTLRDKNIDHCHNTDKIRGLLCGSCNKMLGYSKDDRKILMGAIKYLMKYQDGFEP